MKRMPTRTAEKVYDVLCKFAQAEPAYYQRESFIFHYGVLSDKSPEYRLSCMDDGIRTFHCTTNGNMWVEGTAAGRANSILKKIAEEMRLEKTTKDAPVNRS
jgi:hypothetical protein